MRSTQHFLHCQVVAEDSLFEYENGHLPFELEKDIIQEGTMLYPKVDWYTKSKLVCFL